MFALLKKIISSFSRWERVVFFAALGLCAASTAALAAATLERKTTEIPAHGGDYVEGVVGQPSYVNPVLAATDVDKGLVRLVFSNIPSLAEKVEMQSDRRTWDVRLKENLFWHDGKKLTSDDVLFTIQKIQDPESRSPLALSWQGITARRVSELELNIHLPSPYALFAHNLKNLYVLPKHLFTDIPPANWRLSEYNLKPVGSGPYRFESLTQQPDGFVSAYELRAWSPPLRPPANMAGGAPGGVPNIARFSMRFFRNMDEVLKSFNAGRIDGFAGGDATALRGIRRPYALHTFTTPSYYAAFMNPTHNAALKDPVVRTVLREAAREVPLVGNVLGGHGIPQEGPLPGTVPATSTVSAPDLAQKLDAAGWKLTTSTPARVKHQGKASTTLEAALIVPELPFLIATGEALRDAWRALGMSITLVPMHPEDILSAVIKNRDYDILLFGNVANPAEDLYPFWHSSQRFYPGLNISLFNNKKADVLLEAIREEVDASTRREKLNALAALIEREAPAAFLYSPQYLFVTAKNVEGVESRYIENPPDRFSNVASWYVKTARVLR
jgi:peptide/nickel transport system substrate-binding protein